jgi:hypothetical protein
MFPSLSCNTNQASKVICLRKVPGLHLDLASIYLDKFLFIYGKYEAEITLEFSAKHDYTIKKLGEVLFL